MATLLFFGKLQDVVGKASDILTLPDTVSDTIELRTYLNEQFQLSEALSPASVRVAINSEIVTDPFPIKDGDEIAFLPPVGGG